MFELHSDILDKYQLLAANALTCLDNDSQFTLVLENHGCQPVNLEPGQRLGHAEMVVTGFVLTTEG